MLTYILVWMISLGSLGLYLIAYLFPEIHRKNDFIWGGVGLFYALILAANAKTIPGGLLVGQIASVSLIFGLGQQMLSQRQLLVTDDVPRPEPGSIRDRIRTLIIQLWHLIEPWITLAIDFIRKRLEKPQAAQISEIAVGSSTAEAKGTSFFNQLTHPLSNLSSNLTSRFKSGDKNREAVNTVSVQASTAPDDAPEETAPQPESTTTVAEAPTIEATATVVPEVVSEQEESVPAVSSEAPSSKEPEENDKTPVPAQTERIESSPVSDAITETEEEQPVEVTTEAPIVDAAVQATEPSETASDVSAASPPDPALAENSPAEIHASEPTQNQPTDPPASGNPLPETEETTKSMVQEAEINSPKSEEVIKGGDLQPEEKPKEWNDPDPLA